MPRNRRFGFITQQQVAMRTVAHELGHGAFNLTHTFPEVPQGSTKNLMDYSDGLALYKPQWDLIHNPEFTTGLWDGMEDGASIDYSKKLSDDQISKVKESIARLKSKSQIFKDIYESKIESSSVLEKYDYSLENQSGSSAAGEILILKCGGPIRCKEGAQY